MIDADRIIQIYEQFAKSSRDKIVAPGGTRRTPLENLRVAYWYEGLKQRTGIESPYGLEFYFEEDSFKRNTNGTIRSYPNKWSNYERNVVTPQAKTLTRVERLAPGSTHDLNHPLWKLMSELGERDKPDFDGLLKGLSIDILNVLFTAENTGFSTYSVREPSSQLILDKLERRASLDALVGLTVLVLEANELKQDEFLSRATLATHNVLTMIAIELASRKVVHQVVSWVIDNILCLGTPRNLQLSMDSYAYIEASAFLNLMVYQNPNRKGKCLTWPQRVKVMTQLIHGKMGFDVYHAMRPRYELSPSRRGVSAEFMRDFERSSALRKWGWKTIWSGKVELFPPARLPLGVD
ncbi:hypothetical protein [Pseudomonas sp. Irchel 3E13]|uniref:hypothetical protein n=1 Tax=Pseudomonas sp. Irchel 3E13 TaxID=2008975 RepID=UPI000BA3B5BA|nr:hypothetical protein [Pseudomonas sp. Irchel 3E13]